MTKQTLRNGLKGALLVGGLCALIPSVNAQGIGLKKLDEMLTPTQAKLDRGKLVYQRQCSSCHGAQGDNNTELARQKGLLQGGFVTGQAQRSGLGQIYDIISRKQEGVDHPVYDAYVPYQDRWAVAHYVRSLSPSPGTDPAEVVQRIQDDAINGVCKEELKASIADLAKAKGEEQLAKGKELYAANCASCHGDEGAGNGAAAAALNPPPRSFVSTEQEWKNGTSPMGIFKTLANGIPGSSMAAYTTLSEEDRWALTHYVREWVPESRRQEASQEDIVATCRTLSAPAKPAAINIELAMKFMVEDAPARKALVQSKRGPIYQSASADPVRGKLLYALNCASCHGDEGRGASAQGPYGAVPPYLYMQVSALGGASASGRPDEFAQRAIEGVHATLPDMSGAAQLTREDWEHLHAYVAGFDKSWPRTAEAATPPTAPPVEGEGVEGEAGAPQDAPAQTPGPDGATAAPTAPTQPAPTTAQEANP